MKYFITTLIAFITSLTVLVGVWNFLPLDSVSLFAKNLGATITTINATDTLRDSRAVINTNFSNLNTELSTIIGTTTITTLSSAPNLATVGTITSGTWSGTTIGTTKGGTNLTSYSTGDLLYASASNVLSRLAASSSGEVLTLSGSVPVWRDVSLNSAGNFTFTGDWTFNGGGTATTTFNRGVDIDADADTPLILRALSYIFPSAITASSTVLSTNASGSLIWAYTNPRLLLADNTVYSTNTTSTTTALTLAIPANTITTTGTVEVEIIAGGTSSGGEVGYFDVQFGDGSASSTILFGRVALQANGQFNLGNARLANKNSASSQAYAGTFFEGSTIHSSASSTAYSTSATTYLTFRHRVKTGGSDNMEFASIRVYLK